MERYGLRSYAGPFDWNTSEFDGVLKMIESDFSNFMLSENLLVDNDDAKIFHDVKYRIGYLHDINQDFDSEYLSIYQKYMRRIKRFKNDIRQPTCFIRAVYSEEERLFIEKNRNYIYKIIKKSNSKNEIIFLLLNYMEGLSDAFLWYRLGIGQYSGKLYPMRTMFDSNKDFSEFCKSNILSNEDLERNKIFDRDKLNVKDKTRMVAEALELNDYRIISVMKEYFWGGVRTRCFSLGNRFFWKNDITVFY